MLCFKFHKNQPISKEFDFFERGGELISMPVKILLMLKTEISNPFCKLINFSFYHGKFPDILEIARIIPIFKKGDNQNPSNIGP